MLLDIKNITVHYGKSMAIQDVSLGVPEGAVVSIIGANGAGKSTILRALTGLSPLSGGEIYFQGQKISGKETA
jgi:branched-chain amino acid transport system ATP-binding protein